MWDLSGSQGSRASPSSQICCSRSDTFAELEAAAPRSASCPSLDHADCSDTEITSPTTGRLVTNIGTPSIHYHESTFSTYLILRGKPLIPQACLARQISPNHLHLIADVSTFTSSTASINTTSFTVYTPSRCIQQLWCVFGCVME